MFDSELAQEKRETQTRKQLAAQQRKTIVGLISTTAQAITREIVHEPVNAKNVTIYNAAIAIEDMAAKLLIAEIEGV